MHAMVTCNSVPLPLGINDGFQLQNIILLQIYWFGGLDLFTLSRSSRRVKKLRILASKNQFSYDKCQRLKRTLVADTKRTHTHPYTFA